MKRSNIFVIFSLILVTIFAVAFCFNPTIVYAAGSTPDINSNTNENFDRNLYNLIKSMAKKLNNNNYVDGFNTNIFNKSYTGVIDADGMMIVEDLQNKILDLTTGANAKYSCAKNASAIKSITGLNDLTLSNIETLILDNNSLTSINATDLASLTNLKILKIRNNNLQTLILNENITGIQEIDLTNNNLTEIDISRLDSHPICNFSNNNLSDLQKIKLPVAQVSSLNLSFNFLDLTPEEISALNSQKMFGVEDAIILVQGLKDFNSVLAGDNIKIYQDYITNFSIKIFYNSNSEFFDAINAENNLIVYSTTGGQVSIPAGKIKVEFYSDNTIINSTNFPALYPTVLEDLVSKNISVALPAPSYQAFYKGKAVNNLSQDGDITVKFYKNYQNLINNQNVLSNAQIYYAQTGFEPKNKQEFVVNQNGSFTVSAYAIFDGIKSEEVKISLTRKDTSGLTMGIVVIVVLIVVIAAGYFIVRWIKEGAIIAPLTDKEVFSVQKKKAKKEGNNEDYIVELEKPRHDSRVSDLGFSDEKLVENDETLNLNAKEDDDD